MMKKMLKHQQKAQVSLEFATAFVALIILLLATTKIFVWFGNNIVQRNAAYEQTRKAQWTWFSLPGVPASPVWVDFYNQTDHPLHIFK